MSIALKDVLEHAAHKRQVAHPDLRGLGLDACEVLVRYLDSQQASWWGAGKACMPVQSLLHLDQGLVAEVRLPPDLDTSRDFCAVGLMPVRTAFRHHAAHEQVRLDKVIRSCFHNSMPAA